MVFECVLIDLNTQHDFFAETAPCRVANADLLLHNLRRIIAWARRNQAPVISSLDSHRVQEPTRFGLPRHCLDGTPGQAKLHFTLCPNHIAVEGDNTFSVPLDLFQRHQQVIFRKRTPDLFGNPKADRFLTQLNVKEYVIFGLGLECSVKSLALGLLARHRRTTIVEDGCGHWNPAAADYSRRQLVAKGAKLVTVDELLTRKLSRPIRYSRLLSADLRTHRNGNGNGHSHSNGDGNGHSQGNGHGRLPGLVINSGNGEVSLPARPPGQQPFCEVDRVFDRGRRWQA